MKIVAPSLLEMAKAGVIQMFLKSLSFIHNKKKKKKHLNASCVS